MTPHEQQDNKLEYKFQELLMQYRLQSPKTQGAQVDQTSRQPVQDRRSIHQEEAKFDHKQEGQSSSRTRRKRQSRISRSPQESKSMSLQPVVTLSQQASDAVPTLQPTQEKVDEVVVEVIEPQSKKDQFIRAMLLHVPPPAKKMTQNQVQ